MKNALIFALSVLLVCGLVASCTAADNTDMSDNMSATDRSISVSESASQAQSDTAYLPFASLNKLSTGVINTEAYTEPFPDRNRVLTEEEKEIIRSFSGYWQSWDYKYYLGIIDMGEIFVFDHGIMATDAVFCGRIVRVEYADGGDVIRIYVYKPEELIWKTPESLITVDIDISERESLGRVRFFGDIWSYAGTSQRAYEKWCEHIGF